jgi:hypothetical protein
LLLVGIGRGVSVFRVEILEEGTWEEREKSLRTGVLLRNL